VIYSKPLPERRSHAFPFISISSYSYYCNCCRIPAYLSSYYNRRESTLLLHFICIHCLSV